jgi:molecular chaperone GrpE
LTHITVTGDPAKDQGNEKSEGHTQPAEKEKKASLGDLLQEKEKEAKENYDRYLRAMAELENLKKRAEREKNELYKFANENLLKDLLPVLDNLERALEHGKEVDDPKALLEGVELTLKGFWAVLEKYGISSVAALGEAFDPHHHEAVMVQENSETPAGVIISQLQKGYRLHDRLVRPAMVIVSKKPETNQDRNPESQSV